MHPSYYYFGTPDSDSTNDSYDLTRECFHIEGLSRRIQKQRCLLEGGAPHHPTLCSLAHGTKPNFLEQTKERNSSRFKNCRPSSMRNEKTCAYFSRPLSGSAR
jgi:hypothetical protein